MSTTARTYALLIASMLVIAAAVYGASEVQRDTAAEGFERTETTQSVDSAQAKMEASLNNYLEFGGRDFLYRFESARLAYENAMQAAHEAVGTDFELQAALERQETIADEWETWAEREIFERQQGEEFDPIHAIEGTEIMAKFNSQSVQVRKLVAAHRDEALDHAKRLTLGLVAVAAMVFLVAGYFLIIRRTRERRREERARRDFRHAQDEFTDTLQVMRDEREAQELVRNHLEREIDRSETIVLNRNNSDNRLEAVTDLPDGSPLADKLLDAHPESCMAVRLGREQVEGPGTRALLSCEICGRSGDSTCVPSLVGGEVIGSVLVRTPQPLAEIDRERVRQTVNQAAPVLANLRSLAIAESRASTDELTGLPNKRACDDSLRRMLAHAQRTMTPLAAVMLDLDHFKAINDRFGHGLGDDALAAVGEVLSTRVRASDFAGRYGGEEFLLLLPSTDAHGAALLAEEVRERIATLTVPKLDRRVTASFGIASHPMHALDAETLLRIADRALYAAKAAGRNRVHVAEVSGAAAEEAEAAETATNGGDPGARVAP